VGATRRPPRGAPKNRWVTDGYFDVWLPALAPSTKLLGETKKYDFENAAQRKVRIALKMVYLVSLANIGIGWVVSKSNNAKGRLYE
jgi:uncharacterized protein YeaO (DUF488 family)